jgi:hypothetical protein
MKEIPFAIPLSGTIKIEEDSITIILNPAEITLDVPKSSKRVALEKGETVFDIVLETAKRLVDSKGQNRFTGAELYHEALREHPDLKRNSWAVHVIASAPDHSSYNHFGTKRDYFKYLGEGSYMLATRYLIGDKGDSEENDGKR